MTFAWEHPFSADLPNKLRAMIDHAQNFSEVMHGAPLLYNLLLAEQARRDEAVTDYHQRFNEWADLMLARSPILIKWNRERFWHLVHSVNPRITGPTRDFINKWWDLALSGHGARLCDDLAVRSLIRDRERKLKKN